jgi:hypothetical protein
MSGRRSRLIRCWTRLACVDRCVVSFSVLLSDSRREGEDEKFFSSSFLWSTAVQISLTDLNPSSSSPPPSDLPVELVGISRSISDGLHPRRY